MVCLKIIHIQFDSANMTPTLRFCEDINPLLLSQSRHVSMFEFGFTCQTLHIKPS